MGALRVAFVLPLLAACQSYFMMLREHHHLKLVLHCFVNMYLTVEGFCIDVNVLVVSKCSALVRKHVSMTTPMKLLQFYENVGQVLLKLLKQTYVFTPKPWSRNTPLELLWLYYI